MPEQTTEAAAMNSRNDKRDPYAGRAFLTPLGLPPEQGVLRDLSISGCLVQLDHPLDVPVGSEIEVNLQSNYLSFRAVSSVRHFADRGLFVGISFGPLNARGLKDLRGLIDDLDSRSR